MPLRLSFNRLLPPRLPPSVLNLVLRKVVKRRLARLQDPGLLRRGLERDARFLFRDPPAARYEAFSLPGPAGEIPALWAARAGHERAGHKGAGDSAILFLHGGAYLAGSARTHRHLAAALAGASGSRALVIDYRLAPDHPLPLALDDARAAWDWLRGQGFAPERIAVAGDSAGGGLAFALVAALTANREPLPAAVAAFSPWVDMRGEAASITRNAEQDAMLPADRLMDVVRLCIGEGVDPADWRVSPVLATYRNPPPAIVFASMDEILLDDAIAITDVLRRAGSDPVLELRQKLPHAWPVFHGYLEAAEETVARAGRFLGEALAGRPPS
ncbi:MAG: alpha/beta hydrolase [Pseudomonadota bacterium]